VDSHRGKRNGLALVPQPPSRRSARQSKIRGRRTSGWSGRGPLRQRGDYMISVASWSSLVYSRLATPLNRSVMRIECDSEKHKLNATHARSERQVSAAALLLFVGTVLGCAPDLPDDLASLMDLMHATT
jgi:hypothetical protein